MIKKPSEMQYFPPFEDKIEILNSEESVIF